MSVRLLWLASLAVLILGLSGGSGRLAPKTGCSIDPMGCRPGNGGAASGDAGSEHGPQRLIAGLRAANPR